MGLTYILLSRTILDSTIWRHDLGVLKLFLYLILQARHSRTPKRYPRVTIERGELVTSLQEIVENNEYIYNGRLKKWSRQKVARMLKLLHEEGFIESISDTYGTHLRVVNYELYQNPGTYGSDTCGTDLEQKGNGSEPDVETNNNENNGENENNGNKGRGRMQRPTADEIIDYMSDEKVKNHLTLKEAEIEAEKFMNHYDSNGWLIGGKSPMKDWNASVRNWLMNIKITSPKIEVYQNPGDDLYSKIESKRIEV